MAKATGSLDKKSTKCSPPTKVHQESEDKDRSGSKYRESKHRKDKEDSKSPHKCTRSLVQGSSTMRGEKEPHLEDPPQTFNTSSHSHQLSDMDDPFSLSGPADTSTPRKAGLGGSHL